MAKVMFSDEGQVRINNVSIELDCGLISMVTIDADKRWDGSVEYTVTFQTRPHIKLFRASFFLEYDPDKVSFETDDDSEEQFINGFEYELLKALLIY